MEASNVAGSDEILTLPVGLERAVFSGRLAAELVDRRAFGGASDLLLSMIDVSRERFFTPPERIREIGRRTGTRIVERLAERLKAEWGIGDVATLPWAVFKTLAGQLSDGIGFGMLDLTADERSGLIRVRAWHWPLPETLTEGGYVYLLLEGFVTSLLEAVSPVALESVEAPLQGQGDDVCEFVVGSQQSVRAFLTATGRSATESNLEE